jgi:hypothetical protein
MAGHIRQKKDAVTGKPKAGAWETRWTDGRLASGRPKYRGKTFRTKREAEEALTFTVRVIATGRGSYVRVYRALLERAREDAAFRERVRESAARVLAAQSSLDG